MIIECSNITKSYQGVSIIKNATFKIQKKDRAAIIGVNGAGKSTILNILSKIESYDDGNVFESKELSIGYLEQHHRFNLQQTVYQCALEVFQPLIDIENKLRLLEIQMKEHHNEQILSEYDRLTELFSSQDGFFYTSKLDAVLRGLGFKTEDFELNIGALSGGQKTRLALAKLLLLQPKLLLLDEPTNHLDNEAIQFLEDYLKNYPYAIVFVSHDRYFIMQVSNKIIEVENGKTLTFDCNYNDYSIQKQKLRTIELKHYLNQQQQIKKTEESIKVLKSFNREKSIKRATSKEKQLAKIERIDKPESLPEDIRLAFKPKSKSGYDVLTVKDLSVQYDETVFSNISFDVHYNDRIALIGENGIGKTTLLKAIMKKLSYTGTIKLGSRVEIGYYDQEHESLSLNNSIFQEIHDTFPNLNNTAIRSTLALFNFKNDDITKEIASLSGGERSRIVLAKLLLKGANFLLLDEPTNHLDIRSKEILEDALKQFEGTILFISHDRYFIDQIATSIVEINTNKANTFLGDYSYYSTKKQTVIAPSTQTISINKKSQATSKQQRNDIKKVEKQITKFEELLEELTAKLQLDDVINDYIKYNEITDEIQKIETQLEESLLSWEQLNQ